MATTSLSLPARPPSDIGDFLYEMTTYYDFYADATYLGTKSLVVQYSGGDDLWTWDCPATTGLDGSVVIKAARRIEWENESYQTGTYGPFNETTTVSPCYGLSAATWSGIRNGYCGTTSVEFKTASTITNIVYTESSGPTALAGVLSGSAAFTGGLLALVIPLSGSMAGAGSLSGGVLVLMDPPLVLSGAFGGVGAFVAGVMVITEPPPAPPVRVSLTGARIERYTFDLLHRDGSFLGTLDGVTGGDLEHNAFTSLRHAGRLTLTARTAIDWLDPRIRITYYNADDAYPLGVFIGSTPTRSTDGMRESVEVQLYSTLLVLEQDVYPESVTVAAGAVVTDAVQGLVEEAGLATAITPSEATLPSAMTWPAGTSRLRVVNDLLAAVNYFSADADPLGRVTSSPWRSPSEREPVYTFRPGEVAIHRPAFGVKADYYSVPNRVVAIAGNDEAELVAVAEDYTSAVGRTIRGRWVTALRDGLEAVDQATLDAMAARLLLEGRQVIESVEGLQHAFIPLALNDVVRVVDEVLGLDDRYAVTGWKHRLVRPGAAMTTDARKVVA